MPIFCFFPHLTGLWPCAAQDPARLSADLTLMIDMPALHPSDSPRRGCGEWWGCLMWAPHAVGTHPGCCLGLSCAAHIVGPPLRALGLAGCRVTQKAVPQVHHLRRRRCILCVSRVRRHRDALTGVPENKCIRPGLKLGLLLSPCGSLGKGR